MKTEKPIDTTIVRKRKRIEGFVMYAERKTYLSTSTGLARDMPNNNPTRLNKTRNIPGLDTRLE